MVQKVIKIGSSAGVTIPAKQLKELGIAIGDEIKLTIQPVDSDSRQEKLMDEYEKFVQQYGQTLKNLAQR